MAWLSVGLAAPVSSQVTLIGVRGSSLAAGQVPKLVLLPDGRSVDGLELMERFFELGFGRDEVLVHDLAQGTFLRSGDLQERFATLDAARSELSRLVYDPVPGVLVRYEDFAGGQTPSEVLAAPGTLVVWQAVDAGLLAVPDNCPHMTNPFQLDVGGVGSGSSADGIGDACQCGDVTLDGIASEPDVSAMRGFLAGILPLGGTSLQKCPVGGAVPDCDIVTVSVLRRALGGLTPSVTQVCPAALP